MHTHLKRKRNLLIRLSNGFFWTLYICPFLHTCANVYIQSIYTQKLMINKIIPMFRIDV